mgnify:CR=1 FL=1|tara:strand:+ start:694 stop:1245 length:552 start_codon:yes stop_codon:yes gene_type:complete
MVLLESLSLDLGHKMPDFTLDDPFGYSYNNHDLMGDKGLLIIFTCNHCPYAIAIWNRLIALRHELVELGIHLVAINPNINPDYPDDSPEAMKTKIKTDRIPFPYLVDNDQAVAKAYQAQCTPDLYLLKHDMTLYYHGRLDDNWKDETAVTNQELLESAKQLSLNQNPPKTQYPSMGCSIKWLE